MHQGSAPRHAKLPTGVCLTSAHSLAHQEVRSTETALQNLRQGGTPTANQEQTHSLNSLCSLPSLSLRLSHS
ncbi:Protein CBG06257 [Caenorhabditis briggsae]|uniref:Protein CBG06257 n=1 Tax=Caenorhabditis briggsae TaxID=6238 RepID=A8X0I7_CAEBR|nr:Protein CBG06257 [Caenorhabditis briggsae]CAP26147.1 Protein CBG06257 [Caenorhabditis briggsae]